MPKYESILEYVESSRIAAVEEGLIRGVKILGEKSQNGRRYTREAMRLALGLYEGAKVNVNHAASNERRYEDRIGNVVNVRIEADGIYGDLKYNPKHRLAEQLAWDAVNAPNNVGLSHNIQGTTRRAGGEIIVEEIKRVISVDLVSDPATVKGLHEAVASGSDKMNLQEILADADLSKQLSEHFAKANESAEEKAALETKLAAAEKQLKEATDALNSAKADAAKREKEAARQKLIEDAKLPAVLLTEAVKKTVLSLESDDDAKGVLAALAESAKSIRHTPPQSQGNQFRTPAGSGSYAAPSNAKETAALLKRRAG